MMVANCGHESTRDALLAIERAKSKASEWGADFRLHSDVSRFVRACRSEDQGYFEKFEILATSHKRVLYLDTDVIIRQNAPNPFAHVHAGQFAAVYESDYLANGDFNTGAWPFYNNLYDFMAGPGGWGRTACGRLARFFNSGVMLFHASTADALRKNLGELVSMIDRCAEAGVWPKDQEAFNFLLSLLQSRREIRVKELPPTWNTQVPLDSKKFSGRWLWERRRRQRYWRRPPYGSLNTRFSPDCRFVHYTGTSRALLEDETSLL